MKTRIEGIEEEKKSGGTEEQRMQVERIYEIGNKVNETTDLESLVKILEDNVDLPGIEEYLQPIYIFQQSPSLENAKMVPDPSGFGILEVLNKFVTEAELVEDSEGFVPMKKKKDKAGESKGQASKGKKVKIAGPNVEVIVGNSAPETESVVATEVEPTPEKKPEIIKNSRPNPKLTYKDFLKEKEINKEEKKPRRNIREILDSEKGSEEMDKELAGWADGALKGDKEVIKKPKTSPEKKKEKLKAKVEKFEGDFMYMKQSEIKDLLERAFDDRFFERIRGALGNLIKIFKLRERVATRFKGVENIVESELAPDEKKAFSLSKTESQFVADIIDRYEHEPSHQNKGIFEKIKELFKKYEIK